ncbi:aminotransferase-like domain-containing protein [Paenibacillus nasutitermitis]|uniref:GntR family transcriptional regulator n=1 Tax=Paenibacillus nasutitermitis TaxID=1652958 RepID=A0A917DNJ5_9BACL|nr:PLP-dependent aminotransferase family protein [Paenibacillus nasutitermitis]GGD54899.1 GntR family transcriptional regulator [Paenibacillus nasutitermitis]
MKKYLDIVNAIEQNIREGTYRPGQKLPSIRSASKEYKCSTSTVVHAYAELGKRHVIYSISQSGYYVVEKPEDQEGDEIQTIIDFASVLPDVNVFPYLDFQRCLNKAIDLYKHQLFTYGDSKGLESLRHTLSSHLARDQVFAKTEQIMVTSGAQQALEILAKMSFPNGNSAVLVEQPGYDIYLRYLEAEGIPVSRITRTSAGIDLDDLELKFKQGGIKFFYTMPRYHNPLGTSYSANERKAISRLASKYDVYVVEDDYMADLGEERGWDPIFSHNRTAHIIYVKSFSKVIFPGLRLGAAVLPEHLAEKFHSFKAYGDTSLLSQAALEVYIKNGMYERHKRIIAPQYAARIRALNEAVEQYNHAGLLQTSDVRSGIYVQFKLPQTVNLDRLIKSLESRKIRVVSGKGFYLTDNPDREKFLRISISRVHPEQIEEGIKTIIEETERFSKGYHVTPS